MCMLVAAGYAVFVVHHSTVFHAYRVSAKLHTASAFYCIPLIMDADAGKVCVMQLGGNHLMA
jgi:hypothetical protein